ncbi:MAG: ribonuclease III [Acidimicrobiaceae bacterium]|nr:ribonuclease III [Acidimicrobiia bacterium]MCY4492911.1 ribonuclease III [Acidimicrobiaceae bacterium]
MEDRLGHRFGDPHQLELAVTHRSWCAEHDDEPSNERLELLGDAVLGLVVADFLYRRFPDLPEGHLAKARAAVVNADTLAEVAVGLDLGAYLRLGKGEERTGGRTKPSIVSDAFEAVVGAVYIDGGLDSAREFILVQLGDRINDAASRPGARDYKTLLQESAVRGRLASPVYEVIPTGPQHSRLYRATVRIDGEVCGAGEGTTIKQAQRRAARAAWETRSYQDGARDV